MLCRGATLGPVMRPRCEVIIAVRSHLTVLCTGYSVQGRMCRMQYTASTIKCAVHRIQCAVCRIECAVRRIQCAVFMFKKEKSGI